MFNLEITQGAASASVDWERQETALGEQNHSGCKQTAG